MALRLDIDVVRGEIDNRMRGKVRGRVWLAGCTEPLLLELAATQHVGAKMPPLVPAGNLDAYRHELFAIREKMLRLMNQFRHSDRCDIGTGEWGWPPRPLCPQRLRVWVWGIRAKGPPCLRRRGEDLEDKPAPEDKKDGEDAPPRLS